MAVTLLLGEPLASSYASGWTSQKVAACTAILGFGAWAVYAGLIPTYDGRSEKDANLAADSCLQKLKKQHGSDWNLADNIMVNGGDSRDAIVKGTATHSDGSSAFVCNTQHKGDNVWQVTSVRTSALTS